MTLLETAQDVASRYARFPEVQSVVMAGSNASHQADPDSDVDLYIYFREPITLVQRAEVTADASRKEIGNAFWEPGDEWVDPQTRCRVDAMFRDLRWIEEQIDRVVSRHQASIGYTTCFWYNVLHSRILFDRDGWFQSFRSWVNQRYPEQLKRNIIAKNWPILRDNLSSYRHQIELAIMRTDAVSVHHRITALLASYFDVLFAMNEQPHPGEKRLIRFAEQLCPKRSPNLRAEVENLLNSRDLGSIDALLNPLDELLKREHLLPM
jgi:hypothetical protein